MNQKYRVKLNTGRIIGPFKKEQIVELFIKKRVVGSDLCQLFPLGDWQALKEIKEISDLIKKIIKKELSLEDLKSKISDDSKTLINLSIDNKIKKDFEDSKNDSPKDNQKSDLTNGNKFNEFQFSKKSSNEIKPDYNQLEKQFKEKEVKEKEVKLEEVSTTTEKPSEAENDSAEKTLIVKTKNIYNVDIDKTKINTSNIAKKIKEKDEREESISKEIDLEEKTSSKKNIVAVDYDTSTEMINIKELLPELRKKSVETQDEFDEILIEEKNKDKSSVTKNPLEKGPDSNTSNSIQKKKKMKPIFAICIFAVLAMLFLEKEEKISADNIPIIYPDDVIIFPSTHEQANTEKSNKLYDKSLKIIKTVKTGQATYLDKIKLAKLLGESLRYEFRRVYKEKGVVKSEIKKHIGDLILVFAELSIDAKDKAVVSQTIHKLIRLVNFRLVKDIKVALGAAIFYYHSGKFHAAKNIIENYLRVSKKPSKKLFAYYLGILIETGDLSKAKEVYKKLEKNKPLPLIAYIFMARFLVMDEKISEAESLIKEEYKLFKKRAPFLLEVSNYLFKRSDIKSYKQILKALTIIQVEKSPSYVAKYYEKKGLFEALKKNQKLATKFFRKALKIKESNSLRSKLASLSLGGPESVESLILESKIVHLMNKSKFELKHGRLDNSLKFAIQATNHSPSYIDSHLLLSKLQVKKGLFDASLSNLLELQKEYTLNSDIKVAIIKTYLSAYKLDEAANELISLKTSKFGLTKDWYSLNGDYYLKRKNIIFSIKNYEESINVDPLADNIYFKLAEIYLSLRKYERSKARIIKAMEIDPTNLKYKSLYSKILYELEDVETAIGYLRNQLVDYPDNPTLISDIAIYYYKSGQMKEFKNYKKKIENLPLKDEKFYQFLINASRIDDRFRDVMKYSRELIKLNPGNLEIRMELGSYLYQMNNFKEAKKEFIEIKDRLPAYPKIHYMLAKLYLQENDLDSAMENGELEKKYNPSLPDGNYMIGEIFKRKKEYISAIKYFEFAIATKPDFAEALIGLGHIRLMKNEFERARDLLVKAKRSENNNPEIYKLLGKAYKKMGQNALAIEEFKTYLKLLPNARDKGQINNEIRNLQ